MNLSPIWANIVAQHRPFQEVIYSRRISALAKCQGSVGLIFVKMTRKNVFTARNASLSCTEYSLFRRIFLSAETFSHFSNAENLPTFPLLPRIISTELSYERI